MTLRVKIEIVPFGEEDKARELHRFDIHNMGEYKGKSGFDTVYGVLQFDHQPEEAAMQWGKFVPHKRSDGAIELVRRVLNQWKRL